MQTTVARRMLDELRAGVSEPAPEPYTIPAERYTSEAWLARERVLFARPHILAASSEIAPGACLPVEHLVLVRDRDGVLRGFANACRHRGARLVDAPCAARALVCPYHGWTYAPTGELIHVPHAEVFAGLADGRALHAAPICERAGLVWSGEPELGELAPDLAALELERCVVWKRGRATRACNWKLVIDAFLESYHLRTLHRDSVYRFFQDARSRAERVGPHVRAISARRPRGDEAADLRELVTPSLFIFPATIVIEHPDFVSLITVHPLAPDRSEVRHAMLVPAGRAGEAEHWTRSWELIDEAVIQREDLWICEQIQRGLAAGTTEHLLFGGLEYASRWFHDAIATGVAGSKMP